VPARASESSEEKRYLRGRELSEWNSKGSVFATRKEGHTVCGAKGVPVKFLKDKKGSKPVTAEIEDSGDGRFPLRNRFA